MVKLATCTKCKVASYVKYYEILMNDFNMHVDLNILPLGSYDTLGMYFLEKTQINVELF